MLNTHIFLLYTQPTLFLLYLYFFLLAFIWGSPSSLLNPTDSQGKIFLCFILITWIVEIGGWEAINKIFEQQDLALGQ